jgi:hypothetical protein
VECSRSLLVSRLVLKLSALDEVRWRFASAILDRGGFELLVPCFATLGVLHGDLHALTHTSFLRMKMISQVESQV